MGNSACDCCEQPAPGSLPLENPPTITRIPAVRIPQLSPIVQKHMQQYKPFQDKLPKQPKIRKLGQHIYQGQITYKGKPEGYGIIYRKDGGVFVGEFFNGTAEGEGHYVTNEGSFYHGRFRNNQANDSKGHFVSKNFQYTGSIVNNQIDGEGEEKGDRHMFKGKYSHGKKQKGQLTWLESEEQIKYEGQFDEEQKFTGKGTLKNSMGNYSGSFKKGFKHGQGQFIFTNGAKYVGQYLNGLRHGQGVLYRNNGVITYEGSFEMGLPHGKGLVTNQFGDKVECQWIKGVDQRLLQENI